MNDISHCPPDSFDRLKYETHNPAKIKDNHIDRVLKALHFKLVDDLPMIIWYVTSSL
ncbi:hypothetical protein SAMN05428975_4959 [Mucilaginibacter sp. OK268]|jgi:hypothetical protein|uniref:hypothetical protein n=1 Tax=Mucilaginibacter sp. OK268 TaxID=1881048 RepID=UPI000889E596|nr:hypothetical protein [Mucilaginibacter sp. OK268]SDP99245.1 hypothetical protein SAMN05428975_4959 [Mucilaginibacter sp. OK268]